MGERIDRAADVMRRRRFELAAWMVVESAKPWREADADVAEAIDFCDYYAAEIMRQCRFIRPLMRVTPPDPTRLNPFAQNKINPWGRHNDLESLLRIGREFGRERLAAGVEHRNG